jgi:quercetin dioxygenase-like cupin family protein
VCDKNHNHGLIETWVTPKESTRLRSKLVQLAPGEFMPIHSTGPGREEVITCIFGSVEVMTRAEGPHNPPMFATLTAGEACFIAEHTWHKITNKDPEAHALYCFVVAMNDEQRTAQRVEKVSEQVFA